MIADLLLRPDNRLLGGATGDFSLFGGQPTLGVTFAREDAAGDNVSIAAPLTNDAVPGGPAPLDAATPLPASEVGENPAVHNDAGAHASAATSSRLAAATTNSSAQALDDLVPTALSSGGLVTAGFAALGLAGSIPVPPPATADAAPNPLAPSGAALHAPTLDQLVPQIGTLTAMIAPIADAVSGLADAAAPVTQAVADDVIDPFATGASEVMGAVDPVLAPVTDTIAPVVEGVADAVAPVTAGGAAIAAPAIATIADVAAPGGVALGETVDGAASVVAPAVTPVLDVVAPVASAAVPVTAPIVDAVQPAGVVLQPAAEAVAAVTGEAMGGSDPEAGVQTLVGMVANADAFDMIAPGTASTEEPSPSVIDDLIGDGSEVAPLLGDQEGANDDGGPDLFGGHGGLGVG